MLNLLNYSCGITSIIIFAYQSGNSWEIIVPKTMIEPQVGLQLVVLTDFYCFFFLITHSIQSLIICNQSQLTETISFFLNFVALSFRCIITQSGQKYNRTYLSAR